MNRVLLFLIILNSNLLFSQEYVDVYEFQQKKGLVNDVNQIITKTKYDKLKSLSNAGEYYLFQNKSESGILNKYGDEYFLTQNYQFKEHKYLKHGLGYSYKNDSIIIYDYISKKEVYKYKVKRVSRNRINIKVSNKGGFVFDKNEKIIISRKGKVIVRNEESSITDFFEPSNKIIFYRKGTEYYKMKRKVSYKRFQKEYEIYNNSFDDLSTPEQNIKNTILVKGLSREITNNLFKSKSNIIITKLDYSKTIDGKKYLRGVQITEKELVGYANNKGEIIVPCRYKAINNIINNRFVIVTTDNRKKGMYDIKAKKLLLKPIFEKIRYNQDYKRFLVEKNNYRGRYNHFLDILFIPKQCNLD